MEWILVLYATNGTWVMQYGFVTWAIALYTGGELYATPKWELHREGGFGGVALFEDSTNNVHASINGIPFVENYLLNGTDKGDTTLAIGSGELDSPTRPPFQVLAQALEANRA